MKGFSRKFKRPISVQIMALVYGLLGWSAVCVYVINPFGESYIRLECHKPVGSWGSDPDLSDTMKEV